MPETRFAMIAVVFLAQRSDNLLQVADIACQPVIRVATRVSPGRMNDSIASSSKRPARTVPLTFSSWIGSQPAADSLQR
jgi:hypothetical protein